MSTNRVVVTGYGVTSPIGNTPEEFWNLSLIHIFGGDLSEMKRAVDADDIESLVLIAELVNTISKKIKQLPKPVIMVADGAVAGAAANIAVAVDFCIISERTKFIQAFVGVGLAPDAGGLFLLGKSIGMSRATHLVMTGEALNAEKAFDTYHGIRFSGR